MNNVEKSDFEKWVDENEPTDWYDKLLEQNKRIAELEKAIDSVLISTTDMGSYFEVGIMPISDLQELRQAKEF